MNVLPWAAASYVDDGNGSPDFLRHIFSFIWLR
jgi:hypothetical protein